MTDQDTSAQKVEATEIPKEKTDSKKENYFQRWWNARSEEAKRWSYVFEGVFSIFFTFLWLFLINTFYDELGFLTDDFDKLLFFISLNAIVSVALYAILIIIRRRWFKSLLTIINNIFAIIFFILVITIFPFDFDGFWGFLESLIKPVSIFIIVGICISLIIETGKFVKYVFQGR